jgi:hypothetical protein
MAWRAMLTNQPPTGWESGYSARTPGSAPAGAPVNLMPRLSGPPCTCYSLLCVPTRSVHNRVPALLRKQASF